MDETLTWALAAYGAVLSTAKILVDRLRSRPRVEFMIRSGGVGSELGFEPVVFLWVRNPSERVITLDELGIELPGKREFMYRHPKGEVGQLPAAVPGWNATSAWVALSEIRVMLGRGFQKRTVRIRAKGRDALGKVHRSRPVLLDLSHLVSIAGSQGAACAISVPQFL